MPSHHRLQVVDHIKLLDEAARQDLVPDPSDILVERRSSAVRPLNQRLAEDVGDYFQY